MVIESIPALANLTQDQKWILAAELWRDNTRAPEETPDPALVAKLRERLARFEADPTSGSTWEEVKARLLKK